MKRCKQMNEEERNCRENDEKEESFRRDGSERFERKGRHSEDGKMKTSDGKEKGGN